MIDQYTKVDFHIHSYSSKTKSGDKNLTKDNTLENIDVLFKPMDNSGVNVFSITDHNTFNFQMYEEIKNLIKCPTFKYTNIKNILPGVEFDLDLDDEKSRIHATCIFDDSNEEKLKLINKKIQSIANGRSLDTIKFSEKDITLIIRDIGLDFILIVHQKSDIMNETLSGENDFSRLSEEIKERLIYCDFFTAYESNQTRFRFRFEEYKTEKRLSGNFITGTDCHVWSQYPDNTFEENKFSFSYIKSDCTFTGLKIAITGNGERRIVESPPLFEPIIEHIDIEKNSKKISIPLSKGINAIIGGNTSGKSLLIAKAFDKINASLKPHVFLNKWGLRFYSLGLNEDKYLYKAQGEVRKIFESDGAGLLKEFEDLFLRIDYKQYHEILDEAKSRLLNIAKHNSRVKELQKNIDCIINIPNYEDKTYYPLCSPLPIKPKNPTKLISSKFNSIEKLLTELIPMVDIEHQSKLEKIKSDLTYVSDVYIKRDYIEKVKALAQEGFLSGNNDYKSLVESKGLTNSEKELLQFDKIVNDYLNHIEELTEKRLMKKPELMDSVKEFTITSRDNEFGDLNYVTYPKVEEYNKKVVLDILFSPFNQSSEFNYTTDYNKIDLDFIFNNLTRKSKEAINNMNYSQKYEVLFTEKLNTEYFCDTYKVLMKDEPVQDTKSPGNNAVYYIKTITSRLNNKIVVFDQPEDDIAPEKVRTELIDILAKLAVSNQVIIVTHNPQLVVNLDVDNVICLDDKGEDFKINYGPLYEKTRCDMLKIIADKLDGGKDALKERWRRYE